MAELAAQLMQSTTARMFHDHVLVKEPGNSIVTPWHQDSPYYLSEATQTVSFWVPLDPIPRERTIEYVAGSHRWNKHYRPQRFDGSALFENDTAGAAPDIEAKRNELEILGVVERFGQSLDMPTRFYFDGQSHPIFPTLEFWTQRTLSGALPLMEPSMAD